MAAECKQGAISCFLCMNTHPLFMSSAQFTSFLLHGWQWCCTLEPRAHSHPSTCHSTWHTLGTWERYSSAYQLWSAEIKIIGIKRYLTYSSRVGELNRYPLFLTHPQRRHDDLWGFRVWISYLPESYSFIHQFTQLYTEHLPSIL